MPASTHEHPEEWLATALADGLSPAERRALDDHLAGCARCRDLQADFAALDETLLRGFPAAVGPSVGFETRLVAGFRRRHGKSERWVKLRALVGWLLRQRGAQFAGVAAALLGLVGLGQFLTGGGVPFSNLVQLADRSRFSVTNAIQVRGPALSDQKGQMAPLAMTESESTKKIDVSRLKYEASDVVIPNPSEVLSANDKKGSVSIGDIDVGRDVTAGLTEIHIPIATPGTNTSLTGGFYNASGAVGSEAFFDREGRNYDLNPTFTLRGANTFTGSTTVAAGNLAVSGTLNGRHGTEADAQDQRYNANKDFKGSINYGSPIQTVSQNAPGIVPTPSGTPAPALSTQTNAAPAQAEAPATPAPPDVRKLIRNARAELEVTGFDTTVDAVTAAATRDGGFLDTRNSARGGNGKVSGTLVVKVLPENLDRFLAGLRTLGDLKNQTIQTEDVTKDYFDTDARLRNARRMEDRLLKMLDEVKGKMSEVLQVEKELARVRADIETMQGQLKLYDAQVRYATVTLSVYERDLHQPAAFLLRETATLSLLTADVEKAAAEARRIADAAHVQTVRSEVSRDPSGKSRATLRLLIAPEASNDVVAQIKALGRVENFHLQDERTAQNGSSTDAAAQDPAKVERAPVTLDLTISHDEQISRQVSFTLVAGDVEAAFEKARAASLAAGGEIVTANVGRTQAGHASATLGVRVPMAGEAGLVAAFKVLGRAGEVDARRVGNGLETDGGPVLIQLSVVDAEPAVQQTTVRVLTAEVERGASEIKREAAASHATVEDSTFASESDGRQRAALRFRLPMGDYPGFVERVRALGNVRDFTVQRIDRPARTGDAADANAPAVVDLTLYSEGRIVGESSGLSSTLRRTFGQGAGALMWSVQMIGVALAFLAPWAVLLAVGTGVVWWARRRRLPR